MKPDLFQNELDALRNSAREFSKKYPALAPGLSGASTDPDVERILQGTAFLSAGIREQLNTEFPDFAQSILRTIAPDYLKDIPASTIVEFKPRTILNNPVTIKSGSRLDTSVSQDSNCRFSTCSDVNIHPIAIGSCEVSGDEKSTTIDLYLKNTSIANPNLSFDDLRFYISGDYTNTSRIYYHIAENLKEIVVSSGPKEHVLDKSCCVMDGWSNDFALLESEGTSYSSYRRIQEYFINKNKFLFFTVNGFNTLASIPNAFKLSLILNTGVHNIKADKDTFRLFCTPAINIFDCDAEPITLHQRTSELPLKAASNAGRHYTIHAIQSVHGQARINSGKITYKNFNLSNKMSGTDPVYELIQHNVDKNYQDNILRISYPGGFENVSREILTVRLKCTNGYDTKELKSGDVCIRTHDIPDSISFSNVASVSDYVQPLTDGNILWNLISHLNVNYLPVADLTNLISLLNLYNPTSRIDTREHAANKKRIESIKDIQVNNEERILKGYLIRGKHIEVSIDGSGFLGTGDIFLFGELLFFIFSQFSDINSFTRLTLINNNNGERLQWLSKSVKN